MNKLINSLEITLTVPLIQDDPRSVPWHELQKDRILLC